MHVLYIILLANDLHLDMKKSPLLILPVLLLTSCESSGHSLKIATTFAPTYDVVKRLVKDEADVISLVGTNEPHDFTPSTSKDMVFTSECTLLAAYGHNMDMYAKDLNKEKYYEITENLSFIGDDPHAWLAPKNMIKMLDNVYNKLINIDSSYESLFASNYAEAKADYLELDSEYIAKIKNAILSSRYIVTSHEAFNYLANEYGLIQMGIADIADNPPTSARLLEITSFMKENDVHTIFVEELDELGHAETIRDELAKDGFAVNFKTLNAYECVDVNKFNEDNYISVMLENLKVLEESLK